MTKTLPLALLAVAAASASADSAKPAPAPPPPPASMYRLDVSITGLDADPKAAPATYSLTLEEDTRGALGTGTNLPLQPAAKDGAVPRIDIGMRLGFKYRSVNATTIVVSGDLEMEAVEQASPTVFHKVRVEGATAVTGSTPSQLASVFDNVSHRRVEVSITAH